MTVHVKWSVRVVPHKLIELNIAFMDTILKALSTVMTENRRNSVFSVTKQRKLQEYSIDNYFSLNNYIQVSFISQRFLPV